MRLSFLFIGLLLVYNAVAQVTMTDFKTGDCGWKTRTWDANGVPALSELKTAPAEGTLPPALLLPLDFPKRIETVCPVTVHKTWIDGTHVRFSFRSSSPLPRDTVVTVFTKDNDHLWRQIRRKCPAAAADGTFGINIPLVGEDAVSLWEPKGHNRPWTSLTAASLLEYGVIFELETGVTTAFSGTLRLESVTALTQSIPPRKYPVRDLHYLPANPFIGDTVEVTFRLDAWPKAPYNHASTKVTAAITIPDGTVENVNGFYFEDFLYDADEWDKTKCLYPNGEPSFKLRYCPRTAGKHTLSIKCAVDGKDFTVPDITFNAKPGPEPYRGFVRRDPGNDQFFSYDDGTQFWALGINVRSPFDNRYREVAPYSHWQDMGLAAYDKLFRKYKEKGINVVEVWMCSWWLALEWINDAPGFHGVGHYNQYRAWMLDHIFKLARDNDIYLILVINNHGKFAMHYDTEWGRNPFNKKNGGYLEKCEEYFTNQRAREDTKRLLDYIVARWGATPTLLSWKLFTEVDLTGPTLEYYHDPSVAAWHREMGKYLKQIDLYKHPVTTHWMLNYQRINDAIANLPELDFLSTDAYYSLGGGTTALISLLHGSRAFAKAHKKPLVITEFGGSSYADTMTNLMKQVPIGIWTGFFNEMGVIPMYWWFALLEDKNLYGDYKALSDFGSNEDRRQLVPSLVKMPDKELSLNILSKDDRILAWAFDTAYYLNDTENIRPKTRSKVSLSLPVPKPGKYNLEIWDSVNGVIRETRPIEVTAKDTALTVPLPDFTFHTALKIIKQEVK